MSAAIRSRLARDWRAATKRIPAVPSTCDDRLMSLLREIQAGAIDDKTSVATLLLKCQLLAARIDHAELASWVDHELNGYPADAPLPPYRRHGDMAAYGHFNGYYQSNATNLGIPMSSVDEGHREALFNVDFREPVSGLESFATSDKNLHRPWPPDFVAYYAGLGKIVDGMSLYAAETRIPRQLVIATLTAIRSRVLSTAIEIERAAPDAGEGLAGADPLPREVQRVITNNIYRAEDVTISADVVGADKTSVARTSGRNSTAGKVAHSSPQQWFTRHPWWSAVIVGTVVGIPGVYLAIWGTALPG